ncbi:hypothetical protein ACI3KS_01460 [Microbacterium sp. ZW T5_45]|uniref:hypothetical protein n=1 Tax=Microbacterium sp. ZW T5_45 TaxID=3378080 RepID=UPI003853407E
MTRRREPPHAAPLFTTAAVAYAANCALGAAVASRLIDTSRFRWVHHALYIATCATTAAAVITGVRSHRPAALTLLPAAVPLAAIPYLGTHTRRHPLVALAAAPFLLAGLLVSRTPSAPSDRK